MKLDFRSARAILSWVALAAIVAVPITAAARSELLAWRDPIYIAASFAGIVGLALLLVQPLLIGQYLPGLSPRRARGLHRWIGGGLVAAVIIHVAGLWMTSPPDVIDALLVRSPTPFSVWGVIAMWTTFVVAILAVSRRRLRLRPQTWRIVHSILAVVIVWTTVIHALLIEGTMETVTKVILCAALGAATVKLMVELRVWSKR